MTYTQIRENIESEIKRLMNDSKNERFSSPILDQSKLKGKILLDINSDEKRNPGDQTWGSFVIYRENTIKYNGGYYALGTKEQIQKFIALFYLRKLDGCYVENNTEEHYANEWKIRQKKLDNPDAIMDVVPWCVSNTFFSINSENKYATEIGDLKLDDNLEIADNIFLDRPIIELGANKFLNKLSLDEILNATVLDQKLIDTSCEKVSRLYQKNYSENTHRLRRTLSDIHRFAYSIYNAELRYDEDDGDLHSTIEIGGKRFYELPKAQRASIFSERYKTHYVFSQLHDLVIERSNSFQELEQNVKQYIDKTNPPIFELLIEMGKMSNEILQPCHDFLKKLDY